ncbi:hypothetical protein [Spirosoma endophyticum]|uniref:hypothetical protein n=1 Tax=Spirosoma endophyticum TaxID=662367 RepID=UPI0015A57217|nr:hypothetical protein [Spirosoma endophyticum]
MNKIEKFLHVIPLTPIPPYDQRLSLSILCLLSGYLSVAYDFGSGKVPVTSK